MLHKATSTGNDDCISNRLNSFNKVKELCTAPNKFLRLVLPLATVDGHTATTSVNLDTNAIRQDDLRALAEWANFKDLFDGLDKILLFCFGTKHIQFFKLIEDKQRHRPRYL